jgi:sec-independent protein translocase protein TatA
MPNLGTSEILIIALVILLLFGGSKIPSLMKGLGQGMNEFRKASKGEPEPPRDAKPESTSKERP